MSRRPTWRGAHASLYLIPALALFSVLVFTGPGAADDIKKSGIAWLDYEAGLLKAGKEKKPVVVDFYTSWCRDCKKMDKTTYADPEVVRKLQAGFVTVKVDAEARRDLSSRFGVFGYPSVYLIGPGGTRIHGTTGYMSKEEFTVFLDYALTGAYKNKNYPEYHRSIKR